MKSIDDLGSYSGSTDKDVTQNSVTQLDLTSVYAQFISMVCLQNIETPPKILLSGKRFRRPVSLSYGHEFKTINASFEATNRINIQIKFQEKFINYLNYRMSKTLTL